MIHDVIGNYLDVTTPPPLQFNVGLDQIELEMRTWEMTSTHRSKIISHLAAAAAVG
jgi:hypothetical protein